MLDWTPDGTRLLFASRRESGSQRFSQLYTVAAAGGLPEKLPVPYGEFGALSADGRSLAFTPKSRGFRTWKRYRGGMVPEIWLIDLESLEARNLTNSDANDAQPMWHGSTLYYLSDRGSGERSNIWSLDVASNENDLRQITRFADFDVTFPAIGPSDLVFQAGGRLYRMPLDLRGHGASDNLGRFEEPFAENLLLLEDTHEDINVALRWMAARPRVDAKRLAAIGASYSGEAIAEALRAGVEPVSACVILSPGSFSDESIAQVDASGARWLFIRTSEESEVSLEFIHAVFDALASYCDGGE